jgi:hypothetical protein
MWRFSAMSPRYAAMYIAIGIALGLWLHAAIDGRDAQAEWTAPSSAPSASAGSAFV